jgi:dihydrofolate reductase
VAGKLIYSAIASLDGFVADEHGNFDWAAPDEEVHALVNDLERGVGTYLYGRRIYEVMAVWETMPTAGEPAVIQDYKNIWRTADKVVFSRTLESPATLRTRIEPNFEPDAVRRMKAAAERDLSVGGPHLAAQAFQAGLIDEIHLFLAPVIVGSGNRALPENVRLELELLDERRFRGGFVHLHHRVVLA